LAKIFLFAALAAAFGARAEVVDRIVAVVGSQAITMNELDHALATDDLGLNPEKGGPKLTKKEYLERMIERQVIDEEVKRQGVTVSSQEIAQAMDRKREQLGLSPSDFNEALKSQGITMESYRDQIQRSLVLAKLVSKEVKSSLDISPEEIQSYYQQHQEQFLMPDRVHLYHIVVRNSKTADETIKTVRDQFNQGVPFPDLALKYSEGEEAKKSGDLDWVELDSLKPEVKELVEKLGPGDISHSFRDSTGIHLFWVKGREKGGLVPLDQAKEVIRDVLYQKQFAEQYGIWLERLKAKTYIDIRL
jgi:parvulin-like peptidyl-prolyl isomerase